jgi:two-component system, sensor histidine kinase LadS
MTLFKKLLFLFLTIAISNTFAEELPAKISTLLDSTNNQTISSIITSNNLISTNERSINAGYSKSTLWTKIELPAHKLPVVITIENAHIDYLDCYIFDQQNKFRLFETGDLRKFSTRDVKNNLFSFVCYPNENIVYISAKSEGAVALPLRIHTLEDFFIYDRDNQIAFWLFIGIALIALIANLLFYSTLKEKNYWYYAVYVFSNIVFGLVDNETSYQYLWPNSPEINKLNILLYSAPIFSVVFCNHFLELKKNIPILYKINIVLIWLRVACAFYSLIDYQVGAIISLISVIFVPILIFLSAILVYLKNKSLVALLFLGSWFCYLVGITVYIGATAGIFTYFASISNIVLLTSSVEMVLVFVIVVYKVNLIKEENIKTKSELIALLQQKEKTLLEQYIFLEEKVNERTRDLQLKNEEIMSQNEEILCQNEEMFLQRKQLEEKNKEIDHAHQELTVYKDQLEETVQKRTSELFEANQILDRKNHQLEQFAFMAAHNLRSPVAGIMGLSSLLENDDSPETQKEVITRIQESVKKLDVIVKSMTGILTDPKVILQLFETCDLYEILNESKSILENEISISDAVIITNYDECYQISSIKAYLHNLFYNMLSNAIKYRKADKPVQIEISSKRNGNDVAIIFKDYGLGIDMNKHSSEIFTPFKRFERKIEGSGIGLYLIQTQIKTLGGTIQVESTLGVGTTFTVKLPNSVLD